MADWKYNPENYNSNGYTLIPEGNYRVRIEEAEERTSQSGKAMIKLTLSVSGYTSKVWKYIVLDSSSAEATRRTDQWLGSIYDSFRIESGSLNVYDWEGKTGGARIRHRPDQNGDLRCEVHYFLPRRKVEELPEWQDGTSGQSGQDGQVYTKRTIWTTGTKRTTGTTGTSSAEDVPDFGESITDVPF